MKILVTGASGLLGRSLMAELAPLAGSADALIGTAHSRLKAPLRRLDLTDETAVRAEFAEWSPELVVHSAAERRPVDRGHGRPATGLEQLEELGIDAPHPDLGVSLQELGDVGASHEDAGSRRVQHEDGRLVADLGEDLGQLVAQRHIEGVELVWSVEADADDAVVPVNSDETHLRAP